MPDSATITPLPVTGSANTGPDISIVPPVSRRRSRSILNQGQQHEVQRAKQIVQAAQQADHRVALEKRLVNDQFLTTLAADIAGVEDRITAAISCTHKKEGATVAEQDASAALVAQLRVAQSAAHQKYFHSEPSRLQNYFIGQRLEANRATLAQAAETIIAKLQEDSIPGMDAEFIADLEAKRAAVIHASTTQITERGRGKSERELRDAAVKSIRQRAQQIQFAADAAWPAHIPGNGGIRRQFFLPLKQPFRP